MTAPDSHPTFPVVAIGAAVEAMSGTIAVARALVAAGRRVDLAGLDAEISAICAASLTVSAAEGRALRPNLIALEQEVSALAALLAADGADA